MTIDQHTDHHTDHHTVEPVLERTGDTTSDVDRVRLMLDAARTGVLEMVERSSVHPTAVRLTVGDISVEMDWAHTSPTAARATPGPVAAGVAAVPDAAAPPAADGGSAAGPPPAVTAPAVGVFYRAPEPGATPFVEVGDSIAPGQKVGLIEAMKLMIPVEADRAGTVVEIVGVNGEAVEYGQPLIVLAPATGRE